ncbi:TIR domain-containing protein [Candidatus Micrarchaeota archaeon]|nr:TIR domain-containing protein [Candidatus Micrarchaeota archaeon]
MFQHFFEWFKSRSDPRFKAYREARLIYEAYLHKLHIQFDSLTLQHCKDAYHDAELHKAELLYRQAVELSRKTSALHDVATGLYQLGMLQHLQGRINQAIQSFEESIKILKELPHAARENQATLSSCYYHLGIISCHKGCIKEGKSLINKSLGIDEALNDIYGITAGRSALSKCENMASINVMIDEEIGEVGIGTDALNIDKKTPFGADLNYRTSKLKSTQEASSHARENLSTHNNEDDVQISLKSRNNVVWLLSYSTGANDRFFMHLEQLTGQISQNLIISIAAFGSSSREKATLQALEHNERLCAAIIIIEKDGLKNDDFRYWLNWCIENVADKDDFRLFVYLDNFAVEEIVRLANSGDKLLANLIDTVQLLESTTPEHLRDTLKSYLQKLDGLRDASIWRKLRVTSGVFMGRVATGIQISCGALLAAAIITYVLKEEVVISLLSGTSKQLFAVIAGIILFPVLLTPMYPLFRGISAANLLLRNNPRVIRWLVLFAVLAPAAISLPQRSGASGSYIALGVSAGILLELTRRKGILSQREGLSLGNALNVNKIQFLPRYLLKSISERARDLMYNPLFSETSPKVFISYTRSSDWSKGYSLELYKMLQNAGVKSFLDRESIGEGSSWRTQLNRSIAEANVFIAVIDRYSVTRDWVAAEIITALTGKRLTGLPELIVLIEPQIIELTDDQMLPEMLPVFNALLQEYGAPQKQGNPRLIVVSDSTLQTVVSGLSHRFRTLSVFPHELSMLLMFLTIPLVSIGPIGSFFGWPAALFAYLQYWQKYDSAAILASLGILTFTYLMCGYWLGFIGRLTMASWFEVKHKNPATLTKVHIFSCIGLAGLLAVWSSSVNALILGWAIVLCYTGWLTGNLFISNILSSRADLNRAQ